MKIKEESWGKSVCKAVAYMQTWRFGFQGNIYKLIAFTIENIQLSLIPQVSNPNFNDDKVVFSTLSDPIVLGVYEVMSESEGNLTIRVWADMKIMRYSAVLPFTQSTEIGR